MHLVDGIIFAKLYNNRYIYIYKLKLWIILDII